MASAIHMWQQLGVAIFYVATGVALTFAGIFNFTGEMSPGEMLPAGWLSAGLLVVAWLLTSALVHYRRLAAGMIGNVGKNALLEKMFTVSSLLIWNVDDKGNLTAIEGPLEEKDGVSAADLVGRSLDIVETINPVFCDMLKRAQQGELFDDFCAIGHRYYHHHFFPQQHRKSGKTGFQCISVDITNEQELRATSELSQQVISQTTEAIVILDRQRVVTSVNSAFSQLTDYTWEKMVGSRRGFEVIGQPTFSLYRTILNGLKRTGSWNGEVSLRRSTGELFAANFTVSVIKNNAGLISNYVIFFSDLSHMQRTHEELRYLANHDNLTDLPNRRLFLDRLEQGVKRAQRSKSQLAIFFIDLDNFKLINDVHGHYVGDELLKEIGRRLLLAVRQSDTVARLAGDEFTIITENITDTMEVNSIARKIMTCFEAPFVIFGESIDMSASVGIGVYPDDGEDLTSLLKGADEAMYKAKAEGRNGFYSLSEGKIGHLPESMFFPSELRLALKRGQMELVYQSLHDLRSGRVIGCEGLLRWNHHCRGIIPPADFMTLSEGAGITAAIGQWTLNEACQQLKAWRAQRVDLDYVSINIANSQINDPGYPEMVIDALAKYNLHPSSLMLEIAEGVLLKNMTQACQLMRHLSATGVRFSVDEFGSSLADYSYVRDIPADTLKIDQRLLMRARTGREDAALIRALVGIGDILQKNVVAVGVERPRQEELMQELGCQLAQGFLYAKPMTAELFSKTYTRPANPH